MANIGEGSVLSSIRERDPAAFDALLDRVRTGELPAQEAAAELGQGVTALDVMAVAINGLEELGARKEVEVQIEHGFSKDAAHSGSAPGSTLTLQGFNLSVPSGGSFVAAGDSEHLSGKSSHTASDIHDAATSFPLRGLGDKISSFLPGYVPSMLGSFIAGLVSGVIGAGKGAALAAPAGPLAPVGGFFGFVLGFAIGAAGTSAARDAMESLTLKLDSFEASDPVTREELMVVKSRFDDSDPQRRAFIGAALAQVDFEALRIDDNALPLLDEMRGVAETPDGQRAIRILSAVQALNRARSNSYETVEKEASDPTVIADLKSSLRALPEEDLAEIRPYAWSELFAADGKPKVDIANDPELEGMLFAETNADNLLGYMLHGFLNHASSGGATISQREINLLLTRLDELPDDKRLASMELLGSVADQLSFSEMGEPRERLAQALESAAAERARLS